MSIRAKLSLFTVGLLAVVVFSIACMVVRSQEQVLRAQSARRMQALMEGVERIGTEALANRDRLMVLSYLMVLRKAHPELAYAAVTQRGHIAKVGEDGPGLIYVESEVAAAAAPVKYTVTAYPEAGSVSARATVSPSGVSIPVTGRVDLRVEEPPAPERLRITLGFLRKAVDDEVSRALRPLVGRTVAIAAVFAALGTLASLYLSFLLSAPIKALAATASVAGGAPREATGDEVGIISRRFEEMIARLKALNQSREDLLHTLTHELNTPLGGLKAYLEIWKERKLPEAERDEVLATMTSAVLRMEGSLGNALRLFRSGDGPEKPGSELVWVDEVFKDVLLLFEPVARSKRIRLVGLADDDIAAVYAHQDAVRVTVTNLVSNALKYTPEGGEVSVGLEDSEAEVKLWVSDTGPGIKPGDQALIFTKFYRGEEDRAAARRIPGTGLGLSIAHKAVTESGGRIWVASEPGAGSTFFVSFPKHGGKP